MVAPFFARRPEPLVRTLRFALRGWRLRAGRRGGLQYLECYERPGYYGVAIHAVRLLRTSHLGSATLEGVAAAIEAHEGRLRWAVVLSGRRPRRGPARERVRAEVHRAALLACLRRLVVADNRDTLRESMRATGLFDHARALIEQIAGESLWPVRPLATSVAQLSPPPDLVIAAQALIERLETMTAEEFARGVEAPEREAVRAALAKIGRVPADPEAMR